MAQEPKIATGKTPETRIARRPQVTIYDIARATGFSPSTVSRALNVPGRINVKTEKIIRDAADELGYSINPMARALPTGRTGTIAIVLSDITNPVYFTLIRGAERVAGEHGTTLVLMESQESAEVELASVRRLLPSVDGLILVASRLSDEQIVDLARFKSVITVARRVAGVPNVVPDVQLGLTEAVRHLAELGHRSIGYIAGPSGSWMNSERRSTLSEAASDSGVSVVEIASDAPTLEGGATALAKVHAAGVSAVVAFNDLIAMGLMRQCRAAGIDVPSELSVVGFDNVFGADLITPGLTTVESPVELMGSRAAHRLLDGDEGDTYEDLDRLVTRLIVRESTGPVRRRKR